DVSSVVLDVAVEVYVGLESDTVDSDALAEHSLNHVVHSLCLGILPLHVEVVDYKNCILVGSSCRVERYLDIVVIVAVSVKVADYVCPVGVVGNSSYGVGVENLVAYVPNVYVVLVSCHDVGNVGGYSLLKLL